jgi:hypothetical protein
MLVLLFMLLLIWFWVDDHKVLPCSLIGLGLRMRGSV